MEFQNFRKNPQAYPKPGLGLVRPVLRLWGCSKGILNPSLGLRFVPFVVPGIMDNRIGQSIWRGIVFRIFSCVLGVFFFSPLFASWLLGFLASWLLGFSASWLLGCSASCHLGFWLGFRLFVGLCDFWWLWLFASSAFPVPLVWLPASSASPVPPYLNHHFFEHHGGEAPPQPLPLITFAE